MVGCGIPSRGHDARHNDGVSAGITSISGKGGQTVPEGGDRFAKTGPDDCAFELRFFLRTGKAAGVWTDEAGSGARRPRGVDDVEPRETPRGVLRGAMHRGDSAHTESAAPSS